MKLVGYIDGVEISFIFSPPNQFKSIIPKKLSGIYIVELHAIDDAGNQNNYTNMLITIDFDKLTFNILKQDFLSNENKNDFYNAQSKKNFITIEKETSYGYKNLQPNYRVKELII